LRFQSTSSSSTTETITQANPAEFKDVIFEQLAGNASPGAIEPYHGYMKDLGVDFGFGTTSIIQYFIENLHVFMGGPPWWLTLGISVLAYRALLFRPMMVSSSQMNKLGSWSQQLQLLEKQKKAAVEAGDTFEGQRLMKLQQEQAANRPVSFTKLIFPSIIQGVMGFGIWRLGYKLAEIPHFGLSNGGVLWVPDLTIPDPYYAMPVLCGAIMYLAGRVSQILYANAGQTC
jgi:YidC/Oxa1 family membrane protein insertase